MTKRLIEENQGSGQYVVLEGDQQLFGQTGTPQHSGAQQIIFCLSYLRIHRPGSCHSTGHDAGHTSGTIALGNGGDHFDCYGDFLSPRHGH